MRARRVAAGMCAHTAELLAKHKLKGYHMQYELRTYVAAPGRLAELLTRFRRHTNALFRRHGILPVGYWTTTEDEQKLVYLLRHTQDPETAWAAFKADPEWVRVRTESEANGPLTMSITSTFLTPTDFSDLR